MDVINLSLGEPEIEPSRDIVVAGDRRRRRRGRRPGDRGGQRLRRVRPRLRRLARAARRRRSPPPLGDATVRRRIAPFSSGGPTPVSLQLKPDVTAPGVTSSRRSRARRPGPSSAGRAWRRRTSRARPRCCASGIRRGRSRRSSPRSCSTGDPVHASTRHRGRVDARGRRPHQPPARRRPADLRRPDEPLVRARQRSARSHACASRSTDAGGGAGDVDGRGRAADDAARRRRSRRRATVTVPGALDADVTTAAGAAEGEATGFVVLTHGTDVRRIPYWLRVERAALGTTRTPTSRGPASTTATPPASRRASRRTAIPTRPRSTSRRPRRARSRSSGSTLTKPVANFGVVVLSDGEGVTVAPRIVAAGDENRLVGYAALPVDDQPVRRALRTREPVVGASCPAPGATTSSSTRPPARAPGGSPSASGSTTRRRRRVRLLSEPSRAAQRLRLAVTDAGSGVDPASLLAHGRRPGRAISRSRAASRRSRSAATPGHAPARPQAPTTRRRRTWRTSAVLPNTRMLRTTFVVRSGTAGRSPRSSGAARGLAPRSPRTRRRHRGRS